MREKILAKIRGIAEFFLNPHLLFCIVLAWMITNGWSYILFGFGTYLGISWMVAVSGAYLAFLWLPFTPEKILTVLLAMLFLRWLFPKDEKTLKKLHDLRMQYQKKK